MTEETQHGGEGRASGTTGRYLVLLREDATQTGIRALNNVAGLRVTSSGDFQGGVVNADALADVEALVFNNLGVAVINAPPDQLRSLSAAAEESGIIAIEPERMNYAIQLTSAEAKLPVDYLIGYREAITHLVDRALAMNGVLAASILPAETQRTMSEESDLTWGIQMTRVAESQYTGKGIRVAVLDTGFDLEHPDFLGRRVIAQSFIAGESAQDGNGHGTHVIGTACGPKQPGQLPRYGIAYNADIYVGKVLSNAGSGADAGILAGIGWAIDNECRIVSMSLGAPTMIGQAYSRVFESVAKRALAAGTLIIAAAGNESQRPGRIAPVGHPANCPSIMSVAALDPQLLVASSSCGGRELQGGQVDIAGPGVRVRSSWPSPQLYHTISGTSMATPHVSGIAALHAEANPDVRGGALGWLLLQNARRMDLPVTDVGAGLVQAP
jgi:subtilisin family serine protease